MSVSTFGSVQRLAWDARVVQFTVRQKDGTTKLIKGYAIPRITGSITRTQIPEIDQAALSSYLSTLLADTLCSSPEQVQIDVLLGSDYIWEFIHGAPIPLLSGL